MKSPLRNMFAYLQGDNKRDGMAHDGIVRTRGHKCPQLWTPPWEYRSGWLNK